MRLLPLAPETIELLDHYLRLERPPHCGSALFVSLKGRARGTRMTPEGLRSLFRHHRQTTGVIKANPHRFRHYAASRTMPHVERLAGKSPCILKAFGPVHFDLRGIVRDAA